MLRYVVVDSGKVLKRMMTFNDVCSSKISPVRRTGNRSKSGLVDGKRGSEAVCVVAWSGRKTTRLKRQAAKIIKLGRSDRRS